MRKCSEIRYEKTNIHSKARTILHRGHLQCHLNVFNCCLFSGILFIMRLTFLRYDVFFFFFYISLISRIFSARVSFISVISLTAQCYHVCDDMRVEKRSGQWKFIFIVHRVRARLLCARYAHYCIECRPLPTTFVTFIIVLREFRFFSSRLSRCGNSTLGETG